MTITAIVSGSHLEMIQLHDPEHVQTKFEMLRMMSIGICVRTGIGSATDRREERRVTSPRVRE